MSNYWENHLFPQFLSTIQDCTLSELSNFEIQTNLNNLAIKAIADFKFPKFSLDYEYDNGINPKTEEAYGYYFINENVGQKEFNVIVARMKQYWIEYQISQERIYENSFYDKDIRLHSPGNMIDKLIKMFTTFKFRADRAEYDYGRVSLEGTPALGGINEY